MRRSVFRALNQLQMSDFLLSSHRRYLLKLMGGVISKSCRIEGHVHFQHKVPTIGDGVFINAGSLISGTGGIVIEENVHIGPRCCIFTDTHDIGGPECRAAAPMTAPIIIQKGAWIGANVTIFPGVRIGSGSVIGAGSVVTRSSEDNAICFGSPARRNRTL